MKGYDGGETRAELYPDSIKESKQVLKKMANPDLEYFEKSDKDLLKECCRSRSNLYPQF